MSMFDTFEVRVTEQHGPGLPPLPEASEITALTSTSFHFDPSEWVALNPQPLPPEPPEHFDPLPTDLLTFHVPGELDIPTFTLAMKDFDLQAPLLQH